MPLVTKILLVYLPSTISIVGTGLRLSASRAFGTIVAAGIVAGTPGLGSQMFLAESSANYVRTFSYVVVMGIVGTSVYAIFSAIERKFVVWRVTV
jgi:ABC-type nitrate/sulfonate/bicarbonate transport system permease component